MKHAELVNAVGHKDAEAVLRAVGGTTTRVPLKPETWLRRVPDMSAEGAQHLCREWRDCLEYFPSRSAARVEARHALIRQEHQRGASIRAIALTYDLSMRQVRNIINKGFS